MKSLIKSKHAGFLYILSVSLLVIFLLFSCDKRQSQLKTVPITSKEHTILGSKETCMACHEGMQGFSSFHEPAVIGCTPCHLGDPYQDDKEKSHENMVKIPGNLKDVNLTCGTLDCHGDITDWVQKSLMTSMSGVITIDRIVFGEENDLYALNHVDQLTKTSPADRHLRNLCASCHLGNEKTETGPNSEKSRGGGCNACHLVYNHDAKKSHLDYQSAQTLKDSIHFHPKLSVEVSDNQCFGCHSRSSRISTSYEGWHETQLNYSEIMDSTGFRLLEDGRVFTYIAEDIHHKKGLECIDCHSSNEVMGDGIVYAHSDQAVRIRCEDCHQEKNAEWIYFDSLSEESKKLINLRNFKLNESKYLLQKEGSEAMYNVTLGTKDSIFVYNKNTQSRHFAKPPASACTKGEAHNDLSCQACHTPWVPNCIGCHNIYEPETIAYDLLAKQKVKGKWVEYLGEFFAEPPPLGIVESASTKGDEKREIKTFVSGMILSIDLASFTQDKSDSSIFKRLFSPIAAHTTSSESRSCESCHNDPLALGYGHGKMEFIENEWHFYPEYETVSEDGLPQDAWIGFLRNPSQQSTIDPDTRPFNLVEQRKILTVGACLTCHKGDSSIMQESLIDFERIKNRMTNQCEIPKWN